MVQRQRFTIIGWWGAALFVLGPTISATLLATSMSQFLQYATNPYLSSRAADALYHPSLYFLFMLLGLVGIAMMLVGRETYEV